MAHLSRDHSVLQFVDGDGRRRTIRLGKQRTLDEALAIKARVEALNADAISGHAWSNETAKWIRALLIVEPKLYDRIAAFGLVPSRERHDTTLAAFLQKYIDGRTDWKPSTRSLNERVRDDLVAFFGGDTPLAAITPFDADAFRRQLRNTKAESTTRKICSRAKTMFNAAVRKRLLETSPFADMTKLAIRAASKFTVTREMADMVLKACTDNQWRAVFALCRFGGLRCPSEVLALRWDDVNWEAGRLTVHSPKTEHHEGKELRVIPLFPELRKHLKAVWDELENDPDFDPKVTRWRMLPIITRYRKANANLRTQLERTIIAAGLKPWPVLFNSLRATRANELRDKFPDHVVNAWLGHSQRTAERHYLEPTDAHFDAATRPIGNAARDREKCSAALQSVGEDNDLSDSSGQDENAETKNPDDFENRRDYEEGEAPRKEPSS